MHVRNLEHALSYRSRAKNPPFTLAFGPYLSALEMRFITKRYTNQHVYFFTLRRLKVHDLITAHSEKPAVAFSTPCLMCRCRFSSCKQLEFEPPTPIISAVAVWLRYGWERHPYGRSPSGNAIFSTLVKSYNARLIFRSSYLITDNR